MTHTLVEITVESLGGLGDGVGTVNGKPVFIPKACAGDRLEIQIVHENHDRLQGVITQILAPGLTRQKAPCPYFERCGGCTLQQLVPNTYRAFKTQMLHSALERAGFPTPSAEVIFIPPHSRRRVEFKVKHDNDAIALAFHDLRSHTPTVIDACLLLVPELQSLIAPLNERLSYQPFSTALYSVSLTAADSGIDMLLTFKNIDIHALPSQEKLAHDLGIARISARAPDTKAIILANRSPVEMQLGSFAIALPPESFLQATAEGQSILTRIALEATKPSNAVVDLFCGIGSYSFPLSVHAKVHAVELDAGMVQTMQANIKRRAIANITAEQRDLFKHPLSAQELAIFSAAILNPPRLGAKTQTLALAQSTIKTIVMISCNPATFSRDAAILKQAGFMIETVCGVDQFLWSQHLEIAAVFKR